MQRGVSRATWRIESGQSACTVEPRCAPGRDKVRHELSHGADRVGIVCGPGAAAPSPRLERIGRDEGVAAPSS